MSREKLTAVTIADAEMLDKRLQHRLKEGGLAELLWPKINTSAVRCRIVKRNTQVLSLDNLRRRYQLINDQPAALLPVFGHK